MMYLSSKKYLYISNSKKKKGEKKQGGSERGREVEDFD
jgi:hypothetical protein